MKVIFMNNNYNNILMILSIFVIALFLTGCSQNAPTGVTPVKGGTESVNNQPAATGSNTVPDATGSSPVGSNTSVIGATPDTIKDITIEASSFEFIQTGPQINKGDKVRITFTVTSGTHSLILSGYNIEFTPMGPGGTQSATFVADKSGTFEYHCNNPCGPGHADMVGKLVVN
jgi:cytochrome c oxidase subunit II